MAESEGFTIDNFGDVYDSFGFTPEVIDEAPPLPNLDEEEVEVKENLDKDKPGDVQDEPEVVDTDGEEEQEIVAEETGDEEEEDTENLEGSSKSPYSSLATVLQEEGVLSSFDPEKDKIQSIEDLVNLLQKEVQSREFADLNDEAKQYLEAIRAGVPPKEVYEGMQAAKELSSITREELETNEDLRKELILQEFLAKGMSQEKAEKLTKRSFDVGEDIDDALSALATLKEVEQQNIQIRKQELLKKQQDAIAAQEKQMKDLEKAIETTDEIIPGLKINGTVKEKVLKQITTPVAKAPNGQPLNAVMKARLEDPINFEIKFNYLWHVTKGMTDFSKLVKTSKSNAVKELDKLVKGNTFIKGGNDGSPITEIPSGFDNLGEIL
jgi:hypothetical protein